MLKKLDHLVIAVPDLENAIRGYTSLGFTVVPGGRHTVGTHNALVSFEDGSYLELIAFYEPRPDHRWWAPLQKGGGLVDYCIETDDLVPDTRSLREAGVQVGTPEEKNRVRPDGFDVRWMYSLPQDAHRGVAPFIIQDVTPRRERVPAPVPHENGVIGIQRLILGVRKAPEVHQWYRKVLGTEGAEVRDDELGASGLRFRVGPHDIDILSTGDERTALGEALARRGSAPHSAVLRSRKASGRLDPSAAFGALLQLTRVA